ncbi:MAG TPA: hypothetical protein VF120_03275 [Ktedonobacterales bacterium]
MVERLQRALEHIDELPPELQEPLAELIEQHTAPALLPLDALAGAWNDLPDTFDEMLDTLDHLRHASPPTPPIEEQFAWMDTEDRR